MSFHLCEFSSVQFSCSVVSNSVRPHEPQHARPPCPSPTPGVYTNSCPLRPITPLQSNNSNSLQDVFRTIDAWVKAWYITYPLSYNVPDLM